MLLKTASLSPDILHIIRDKGTEPPHSAILNPLELTGSLICRQCGSALFRTSSAFHSHCGWPSFDAEIPRKITEKIDRDGLRTEIVCSACHAHLGHVFYGEQLTALNVRYCVNSLSLDFIENATVNTTEEAIVAAGCFWGVEYYYQRLAGVLKTEVGYIGGTVNYPDYQTICRKQTGHVEAIRVIYDPQMITYESILKYFFEIHDPTQIDGQGPDIGQQYLSKIFYYDTRQKEIADKLIQSLLFKKINVITRVVPMAIFWRAEDYHQNYYFQHNKQPYCHRWLPRDWR